MDRTKWVDISKAIGIFLVAYGHLVERVYNAGSSIAFEQFKFIYAFHMPLFFFSAGFFCKKPTALMSDIHKLFLRRLLPVFTFAALFIPVWIIYLYRIHHLNYTIFFMGLNYLSGQPSFDIITWFLICLFSCEVLALFVLNNITSKRSLIIISVLSLLVGLVICDHITLASKIMGIAPNTWYIHEAIVALGFYLAGYLTFPYLKNIPQNSSILKRIAICIVTLLILVATYNLNSPSKDFTVMMAGSLHGLAFPFLLSSFAGIISMIYLSTLFPSSKALLFIGQNTLILLGLNGLFHHFLNPVIVGMYVPENNWMAVTIYCILVSFISILVCVPLIFLFNKYIPQLMGKSNVEGPIFPSLENKSVKMIWNELRLKFIDHS